MVQCGGPRRSNVNRDREPLRCITPRSGRALVAREEMSLIHVEYGGLADKIQGAVLPLDRKGYFTFTRNEPVGVVAAITRGTRRCCWQVGRSHRPSPPA